MVSGTTAGVRAALAAGVTLLSTAAVVFTLDQAPADVRVLAAVVSGLEVAVPMLVALAVLHDDPGNRFSRMLFAAGLAFSLTTLAQAHDAVLYSLGRVSVWFVVPILLWLLLTFPSGRLAETRDRRLVHAAFAIATVLYLPTALLMTRFPTPSVWVSCGQHCPENAFSLVHLDIGFVKPLREVLTVAVMLAVVARVAQRRRRAGPLQRRVLTPVLAIAGFQVVVFAVYLWARAHGPVPGQVMVSAVIYELSLPAVALAFASGLVLRRLQVGSVLQRLTLELRAPATPEALRARLAAALEDPTLRIAYWRAGEPGGWVDEGGVPTAVAAAPPQRLVTEVETDGERVAAVVHDGRLGQDPSLIEAAASYGLVVLENTRLIEDLHASRGRLSAAEGRVASIAEGERRKIERDLHDGAQQQLLALRIRLSLLTEELRGGVPERVEELDAIGDGIDDAVDVVRTLAHGSAPMPLTEHGLAPALQLVAVDATLPAAVRARGVGRYSDPVEAAVYFSCVEALQNAVKHAHGATGVTIALVDDGALRFEVSDDGPGFAAAAPIAGSGLHNIGDRLTAVGGTLAIHSAPGHGTRITGIVPVSNGGGAPPRPTGAHACETNGAGR
jgi:signal transduction histidine kinase